MSILRGSRIQLTYADYEGFPEDGKRHEIIDGEHVVTPSPSSYHQSLSLRIAHQLFVQVEDAGRGRVLTAPMDVRLSEVDIVQPDVLVVLNERSDIIKPRYVEGAPDLIVEILSKSTAARDRQLKRTLYEKSGVREYWIVDPDAKSVEQLILDAASGRYASRGAFADELLADALPGVRVDLTKIW